MVDNWWHEVTKLLIEKALQNELNTLHNKKIVWDKIGQGMANEGYSGSAQPKIKQPKAKISLDSQLSVTKYLVTSDKNGRCLN